MHIKVQTDDFNYQLVQDYFAQDTSAEIGAIVTFTGLVRDFQNQPDDKDKVTALTLEHYPAMTEKVLTEIAQEAQNRWRLNDIIVVHRVGTLFPKDNIVLVATASAHRQDAFDACQFVMDFLKTSAPFWKKEETTRGDRWVDARVSDEQAKQKWLHESILK